MSVNSLSRLHFPAKIYLMLENESPDVIRWEDGGRLFRIADTKRFQQEIIPKYFRHNQLSSVQRQMNLYGFKCNFRGEDKGSFHHPEFFRGNWEAVKRIRRCLSHSQNLLRSVRLPGDDDDNESIKEERMAPYSNSPIPPAYDESPSESPSKDAIEISSSDDDEKQFPAVREVQVSQCQAVVKSAGPDMVVQINSSLRLNVPSSLRVELGFRLPSHLTVIDSEGVSFHLAPASNPIPVVPAPVHVPTPVRVPAVPVPPIAVASLPLIVPLLPAPSAQSDVTLMASEKPSSSGQPTYEELTDMWGDIGQLFYTNQATDTHQ